MGGPPRNEDEANERSALLFAAGSNITMTFDKTSLELRRSPLELFEYVDRVMKEVNADSDERKKGMLKKGWHKEFLDEIIPLSYFSKLHYPCEYRVQPVLGNQGYDALVFDERGLEVERVEVTSPQDGRAEAEDCRLAVSRGYGAVHGGPPGYDLDALFPHVHATCKAKANKDYSDCTLVVSITPLPPYPSFVGIYEAQISKLISEMKSCRFNAKEVFLLILPDRLEKVQ